MEKKFKLGNQLEVNRLGYGAMQLTGPGVIGDPTDRPNAIKVLQAAVEQGIQFIDTADAYGPFTNEILIGEALKGVAKDRVVIATKGGFVRPGPGQWTSNGDPKHIASAIDGSLKRLGVETLDLWQLHRIDPRFPVEDTLAPVASAVKAGKIKLVGLSEVGVSDIKRAQKIVPIASVQNLYTAATL